MDAPKNPILADDIIIEKTGRPYNHQNIMRIAPTHIPDIAETNIRAKTIQKKVLYMIYKQD